MFYKKGIDICNNKSMFNFLNDHFRYATMNLWNGLYSFANNVKVYKLNLSGDCWKVLSFLRRDAYIEVSIMMEDWEAEHPGYRLGFNGRSDGYIVLYNKDNARSVFDEFEGYDTYEDWKEDIKGYGYSVSDFHDRLVELTRLVQDFDKFCDRLRDYTDELSQRDFTKEAMLENIESFNEQYDLDLIQLDYQPLEVTDDGRVNITEIKQTRSLYEALRSVCNETECGYKLVEIGTEDGQRYIKYVEA